MWGISGTFIIKCACASVIFVSLLTAVFTAGPAVETRFFPVVGKLQILKMEPVNDSVTAVWAAFAKRRDCEFIGIAWFRGRPDKEFERVPLVLMRDEHDISSPNRPVGYQKSGPWQVAIPYGEIVGNSFARLYHRCQPFWISTTEFYP